MLIMNKNNDIDELSDTVKSLLDDAISINETLVERTSAINKSEQRAIGAHKVLLNHIDNTKFYSFVALFFGVTSFIGVVIIVLYVASQVH